MIPRALEFRSVISAVINHSSVTPGTCNMTGDALLTKTSSKLSAATLCSPVIRRMCCRLQRISTSSASREKAVRCRWWVYVRSWLLRLCRRQGSDDDDDIWRSDRRKTGGQSRASDPVEYIVAIAHDDDEIALTDVIDARHRPRWLPAGRATVRSVDTVSQTGRCRWWQRKIASEDGDGGCCCCSNRRTTRCVKAWQTGNEGGRAARRRLLSATPKDAYEFVVRKRKSQLNKYRYWDCLERPACSISRLLMLLTLMLLISQHLPQRTDSDDA